ncbi:MAG: DUF1847 domain-containing protein [Dehalococcoidia bacterium]
MTLSANCAKCTKFSCCTEKPDQGPKNCPIKVHPDAIESAWRVYQEQDVMEFARFASVQEAECYMHLPEGMTPRNPRIEEIAQFAHKMGYTKLGVAFCVGLTGEARTVTEILENRGFDVVSVCCKVGAVSKNDIGVTEDQKIADPGQWETMCNPVGQAQVLNAEETHFNVAVGLCVGHDSLFFKHADAPTTVLVAKDRVFGHNPAAGLYLSNSYYGKLRRKE